MGRETNEWVERTQTQSEEVQEARIDAEFGERTREVQDFSATLYAEPPGAISEPLFGPRRGCPIATVLRRCAKS